MKIDVVADEAQASPYVRYGFETQPRHGIHALWGAPHCVDLAARQSDPDPALQRLLAAAACVSKADLGITGDSFALGDDLLRRQGVVSINEALAVLGLWLRSHSRPVLHVPPGMIATTSHWTLYQIAVHAALPAGWRYASACRKAGSNNQSRVGLLAVSAITRLCRALRARDEIQFLLWDAAKGGGLDELLYHLDVFLLMLGGAYDSMARTAYLVHGLGTSPDNKSWHAIEQMPTFETAAPGLHKARDLKARGLHKLISALRNSIHEEPLLGESRGWSAVDASVAIPTHLQARVRAAAGEAGSAEKFGIRDDEHGLALYPGPFVEATIVRVLCDVNRLMAATEVERVGAADPAPGPEHAHFGVLPSNSALLFTGLSEFRSDATLLARGPQPAQP